MIQEKKLRLVGLMGAGKTTVGRQLARRMGLRFIDSDQEIQARTGVRIPTIFEIEGEDGFRKREALAIAELSGLPGVVLATGGGAILLPENRAVLRDGGWVVYLNVHPADLFERTRNDKNRPLLQTGDPRAKLNELYLQRDPIYREVAHCVVDSGRMGATAIVNHIIREYEKYANTESGAG